MQFLCKSKFAEKTLNNPKSETRYSEMKEEEGRLRMKYSLENKRTRDVRKDRILKSKYRK